MGDAKIKSLQTKASVDYESLDYDIDQYLRTNGGEYWRELFIPLLQGVIGAQGREWASILGMEFDVRNLAGEQWFAEYTLRFAEPINQTTSEGLHVLLAQALEEGWSIQTTQNHIGEMFTQWTSGGATAEDFVWYSERLPPHRTEMIARTETMRASNVGSFNLFTDWRIGYKGWLATGDDRTRPSHARAGTDYSEGGAPGPIPIDQSFIVGGSRMMFPGDPTGPAGEFINCRCTILPYPTANSIASSET